MLLLAAFVLAERRVSHPLLPLRVILDRTRGGAYVAVGLAGISIFGVFLFLTYYLQVVKGYSPLTTGLLFLPFVGCILVSSNVSSIVTLPRFGPRVLIASGMLLGVAAMTYLTQLTVTSELPGWRAARHARPGPGLRHDLRPGHQHRHGRAFGARTRVWPRHWLTRCSRSADRSGMSALSTIALTATASYLTAHHTGALAPAIAATHGYTVAFAVSAALLGLGVILTVVLLPPSKHRLEGNSGTRPPPPSPPPQPRRSHTRSPSPWSAARR